MKVKASTALFTPPEISRVPQRRWLVRLGLLCLAAVLTAAGGLSARAQTYLIDFGGSSTTVFGPAPNDDPNNYWNNLDNAIGSSPTGALSNLVSTLNTTSSISILMLSRFNGVNENGTQNSTLYPVDATRDSLYGNTELWSGLENIFPSFKLVGLDAATTYSFTFFASRMGASDNRETGYTVTGGNAGFAALNASNNEDQTVTVSGIMPNESGEITISMAPTANNNNQYHFTYLGVLKVDAIPPQTPLGFTLEPVSQRVVQFKPVTFTAAVTGAPPYSVQWYQNGTPIPGETRFSYTIPSVELYMDGWQFQVSVSNLAYGVMSSNAVLTVSSDTNPPVLLAVNSYDGVTVVLRFNEPMDATVYNHLNYQVNGGAVNVVAAAPDASAQVVTLTLDAPISGAFTVVVNGVQDLVGNPIAPNTMLAGTVTPLEEQEMLFDFGGSNTTGFGPAPDDPVNYWNNVTTAVGSSDAGVLANLITVHNAQTPYSLVMLKRFGGANENGTLLSTVFPAKATRDSLYGNTEVFQSLSNVFPSFKLTGLNPSRQYSFTFYASRTGVSDNRETGYTLEGANTGFVALNAANNINNTATANSIAPNAAGEITISLAPTANNNNANHFTYLGVMRVAPYVPPPVFLPPVIENGQIKLQWTGTGRLLRASSVLGPWQPVEPSPASPYTESLVPGESRYYRLQQ
jgi:hypothetical protein